MMQFNEFLDILDLIKNVDKYEAALKQLTDRKQQIEDAIAEYHVVGDIGKAKQAAEKQKVEAVALLEKAKEEAKTIVDTSRSVYDKRHDELKKREILAEQAITNYTAIQAQMISRENEFASKERSIETLRKTLQTQQDELSIKSREVDERLGKLRQVMG